MKFVIESKKAAAQFLIDDALAEPGVLALLEKWPTQPIMVSDVQPAYQGIGRDGLPMSGFP